MEKGQKSILRPCFKYSSDVTGILAPRQGLAKLKCGDLPIIEQTLIFGESANKRSVDSSCSADHFRLSFPSLKSSDISTHRLIRIRNPNTLSLVPINMSDATETKPTPSADQTASSEPGPAADETTLASNPAGDESKEAPKTDSTAEAGTASTASGTLASTAAGVKDSVFSMFGGGGKKEKKVEEEDDAAKEEPSGSSKAAKKDDDEEVRAHPTA